MANSKLGKGTTFYIYLPATKGKLRITKKEALQPSLIAGLNILVMDDEKAIRELLSAQMTDLGYEVQLTSNGKEAIKQYTKANESDQPFDAVILDLTIPGGIGGKEVIEKLLEIDPKVRAIVSSGYSNDLIMANYKKYGFKGVVTKPYKIEELEKILQSILEKKG
jgi:CheY-like chemotaxis protein